MRAIIPMLTFLFAFTSTYAEMTNPINPPVAAVQFDLQKEFVFITFSDKVAIEKKCLIEVFNEKGKRIFKSKTKKGEKISELNMHQLKQGTYLIQTTVGEVVYRETYRKA